MLRRPFERGGNALAASPTTRSPVLVKATTEGVVRLPSEFSRTTGSPPSIAAMQEFVVPKSMPKTFAIKSCAVATLLVAITPQVLFSSEGAGAEPILYLFIGMRLSLKERRLFGGTSVPH